MQTATIGAGEIPPITPGRVAEVAAAELEAAIALLEDLDDGDWARPTDCAGWTVHDLTAHLAGQYQGLASLGVYLRRHRRAHRRYPALSRLDADNRQQIDDLGGRPGRELVAMLAAIGPKAIRARRRAPGLVRRQRIGWMYPRSRWPTTGSATCWTCWGCATPGCTGSTPPAPPAGRWCSATTTA
jgi:uncharacterized protein (TIGR03083 family)